MLDRDRLYMLYVADDTFCIGCLSVRLLFYLLLSGYLDYDRGIGFVLRLQSPCIKILTNLCGPPRYFVSDPGSLLSADFGR